MKSVAILPFLFLLCVWITIVRGRSLNKQNFVPGKERNNKLKDVPVFSKRSGNTDATSNSHKKRAIAAGLVRLAALIGRAATKTAFWSKLLGSLKRLASIFPKQIPRIISYGEFLINEFKKHGGMSQAFKDFESLHATNVHTTQDGDGLEGEVGPFTVHVEPKGDSDTPTFEAFIQDHETDIDRITYDE